MVNVLVINDRHATVAHAEVMQTIGGQIIQDQATGSAKREPKDVRDDVLATDLAIGRALVNLGNSLQHTARVLIEDGSARQEHEAMRRVRNQLRKVRPAVAQRRMTLDQLHQERGIQAAETAAFRRGVEDWVPGGKEPVPGRHEAP
jgi:hypothetical protein